MEAAWFGSAHQDQHTAPGSSGDDKLPTWAWGWCGLVISLRLFMALLEDK